MAKIENTFVDFALTHPRRMQLGLVGLQVLFRETKMRGWSDRGKIQLFMIKNAPKENTEFKFRYIDSGQVTASSKIPMIIIYRQRKKRKPKKEGTGR